MPPTQQLFSPPRDVHLLITTPSTIFAWDSAGLHTIFKSSKSSIVAAREVEDGSGFLAVANRRVVVLHDTSRGQERSWGLRADDDEVRNLEYSKDGKSLYLSTCLTNDIQRYSAERSRLLSPVQRHAHPPNTLAISPIGQWIVSTSDNPPTVYLKNIASQRDSELIQPRASESAVSVAAFHPERGNIFLLAFTDGTVAAYDATKIMQSNRASFSNHGIINDGEIGRFQGLHRTTSKRGNNSSMSKSATSIADAAFLPGYKTRAVSVGSDGRCRLVDFADGGAVLRTWHSKAPLTSVSVMAAKAETDPPIIANTATMKHKKGNANSYVIGGPTSTNSIIAIGRADGKVGLYDPLGLLHAQKATSKHGEKVISVCWVKGPSPKPVVPGGDHRELNDAPSIPLRKAIGEKTSPRTEFGTPKRSTARPRKSSPPYSLGLPQGLRRPDTSTQKHDLAASRRFTIHPDEAEEGTVRHFPSPKKSVAAALPANGYLDLFSPVKIPAPHPAAPVDKRLMSPPRTRPRISSQTYVKNATPILPGSYTESHDTTLSPPMESHATSSGSETARPAGRQGANRKRACRMGTRVTPFKKRRISMTPMQSRMPNTTNVNETSGIANENDKVFTEIRKVSRANSDPQNRSVLPGFPQNRIEPSPKATVRRTKHHALQSNSHVLAAKQKVWHPGNVLEREAGWPTDSVQDVSADEDEDDIWLTSGSDNEAERLRRRKLKPSQLPLVRHTSLSKVDSKGTKTTANAHQPVVAPPRIDGSTEDDMVTARTHLSPDGVLSPASDDVRELFPRTSSLSPKRKRNSPKRSPRERERERTLTEIAVNSAFGRQSKTPWAKVRATKASPMTVRSAGCKSTPAPMPILKHSRMQHQSLVGSPSFRCFECAKAGPQIADLENEIVRLKGAILALKAVLRRNGVSVPTLVR